MGEWKDADCTAACMPITGLISGLVVIAGGIAGIVLGTQANGNQAGSGNTTIVAGSVAITAGLTTVTGAIATLCMKLRDVRARDDGGAHADQEQQLEQMESTLADIGERGEADRKKIDEMSTL